MLGHFMIVGVGGSGKKSLTTLAAALSNTKLMMIEPRKNYGKKEFREDIFKMMMMSGVENI
jgi:dynein heavy chain, axonemal